jgi:hypothetical protein
VPEDLEDEIVYVSLPFSTVIHKCCCGCGHEVVTPLSRSGWKLTFDGESISLDPSIGNWALPCRSHYWIENNRVYWAGWEDEAGAKKTAKGRGAKAHSVAKHEDSMADRDRQAEQRAGRRGTLRARLRQWLHHD